MKQQYLAVNQKITSTNKEYSLTVQTDSNLVIQRNTTGEIIWTTDMSADSSVTKLVLSWDSDLALFGANEKRLWSPNVKGPTGDTALVMKNNGNLALCSNHDTVEVWSSNTRVSRYRFCASSRPGFMTNRSCSSLPLPVTPRFCIRASS